MMGDVATGRVPDRGRGSPRGYVGVVGPSEAADEECALAREVGALLAGHGFAVITGGLGGIMRAASQGTAEAGGLSIGLLPGASRDDANPHVTIALPTGMGEMRNALLVRSCDAIIAVGGSWGTLSEVALACRGSNPRGGRRPRAVPDRARLIKRRPRWWAPHPEQLAVLRRTIPSRSERAIRPRQRADTPSLRVLASGGFSPHTHHVDHSSMM